MDYFVEYHTDVGIKKQVNQDSLCIKKARTAQGTVLMVILCDGMGGLSKGEVASAAAIHLFSEWFDKQLPDQIATLTMEHLEELWLSMIAELNERLRNYGECNHVQLGTTLSGLFIAANGEYLIAHVGDSRIYRISEKGLRQLTEDHSLIAREIKRGNLTKEQAAADPRKNVLLQCVGVSQTVEPQTEHGRILPDEGFLLCTDGFRHVLSEEEIFHGIGSCMENQTGGMKQILTELVEVNKRRGETDNITVIMIKNIS